MITNKVTKRRPEKEIPFKIELILSLVGIIGLIASIISYIYTRELTINNIDWIISSLIFILILLITTIVFRLLSKFNLISKIFICLLLVAIVSTYIIMSRNDIAYTLVSANSKDITYKNITCYQQLADSKHQRSKSDLDKYYINQVKVIQEAYESTDNVAVKADINAKCTALMEDIYFTNNKTDQKEIIQEIHFELNNQENTLNTIDENTNHFTIIADRESGKVKPGEVINITIESDYSIQSIFYKVYKKYNYNSETEKFGQDFYDYSDYECTETPIALKIADMTGGQRVQIQVMDKEGNTATEIYEYDIVTGNEMQIELSKCNLNEDSKEMDVTISSEKDTYYLHKVNAIIRDSEEMEIKRFTKDISGFIGYTLNITNIDFLNISGTYTLTVECWDENNNYNEKEFEFAVN